jgi:hypothetical protein
MECFCILMMQGLVMMAEPLHSCGIEDENETI